MLSSFLAEFLRSDLRNYPGNIQVQQPVLIRGITTLGDILPEFWIYDDTSFDVDNGTTVIKPTGILTTDPGRFLLKFQFTKKIDQSGTSYSKEYNGSVTTATSTAVFNIASSNFASIVNIQPTVELVGGTVANCPLAVITARSLTSITVSLFDSKATGVLLGGTVDGLEAHASANTIVHLCVKGN